MKHLFLFLFALCTCFSCTNDYFEVEESNSSINTHPSQTKRQTRGRELNEIQDFGFVTTNSSTIYYKLNNEILSEDSNYDYIYSYWNIIRSVTLNFYSDAAKTIPGALSSSTTFRVTLYHYYKGQNNDVWHRTQTSWNITLPAGTSSYTLGNTEEHMYESYGYDWGSYEDFGVVVL